MRLPRELSGRAQPIARIPRARRTKGAGERPTGGRRCAACNRGFRNRYRRAIFRLSLRTGNIRCQATVNARSLAGPTRDTRVPPVFTPGDGQPGQAGAQSVGCCRLQHGVVPPSGHRRAVDTGQQRRTLSQARARCSVSPKTGLLRRAELRPAGLQVLQHHPPPGLVEIRRGAHARDGLEHGAAVAVVVEQLYPSDVDPSQLGLPLPCRSLAHAAPPRSFHAARTCCADTSLSRCDQEAGCIAVHRQPRPQRPCPVPRLQCPQTPPVMAEAIENP